MYCTTVCDAVIIIKNENDLHDIQIKRNKIILRCFHYANKQGNILLLMIFSTPAIKARFLFDILVRNVIYQKRMKIPWNTHISSTNSFIHRSTICFAFCHCLKVSATPSQ